MIATHKKDLDEGRDPKGRQGSSFCEQMQNSEKITEAFIADDADVSYGTTAMPKGNAVTF
jgi:hypothetical protein